MANQRSALPLPADELARARAELNHRYGSTTVDAEDHKVLLIRVPHAQPDPVNDVELAVDFLQPGDVEDITHCLLIGDQALAQVYARPLQDLMAQRIKEDRAVAAAMRQRMPTGPHHELFQSHDDPRKRWRLAIRLPVAHLSELHEDLLMELFDVLGPQLDTPRMKSLCAVYLIAELDDARLEPDLFLQDVRTHWEDEDRHRRAELAKAQAAEAERRAKEEERERLMQEMDRRLGRGIRAGEPSGSTQYPPPAPSHERAPPSRPRDTRALEDAGIPVIEAESTIIARPAPAVPGGPWAASADSIEAPAGVETTDRPLASSPDVDAARAIRDLDAATRAPATRSKPVVEEPESTEIDSLDAHLEHLRNRVEKVLDKPKPTGWRERRALRERRAPIQDPRPDQMPWRDRDRDRRAPMPDPRPDQMPWRDSDRDRSWGVEARGDMAAKLESAGFDVLYEPPAGLGIDLAAERPEGDPQRIVVRCAQVLDTEVARGLLKTARELDVDAVLCVCDKAIPEGERLLVATKVRAVRRDAIDKLPL